MAAVYLLDEDDYVLLEEGDSSIEKLAARAEEPGTIIKFPDIYKQYPATDTVSATAFVDNIPTEALIANAPNFDDNLFPTLVQALIHEGRLRHKL
jgi:hypothetical protein